MCVPLQLSEEMSLNYSSAAAAKRAPLFQQTRLPSRIYGPFNSILGDGAALCDTDSVPEILIHGTGLSEIRQIIKPVTITLVISTPRNIVKYKNTN